MTFYGHVHFNRGSVVGAIQRSEVMRRMAEGQIIEISEEELARMYIEDKDEKTGSLHTYTLHSLRELFRFRRIMHQYVHTLLYKEDVQWWTDRKQAAEEEDAEYQMASAG